MKFFFTISLLALSLTVFAQPKTVYYLKYNGNKVPVADSADYIRIITPPDSASTLFNVQEYYTNGKRKLVGKSTAIDPIVLEGQCATFYSNGNRESVTDYSGGTYLGNSYVYYPNGKLHTLLTFDTLTTKNIDANFKILSCTDTAGKAIVTDGNGHYIDYNPLTGNISEQGDVKNGNPDGDWHGSYASEKITYTDTYRNGQFVSGVCQMPNGVKYTYQHKIQGAAYTGGDAAFLAYLKKKAPYKTPAVKKGAAPAAKKVVLMTFIVTPQGKPINTKLFGSYNPVVDKALIAAASTSAGWKPAMQNGRPVQGLYNIAINL